MAVEGLAVSRACGSTDALPNVRPLDRCCWCYATRSRCCGGGTLSPSWTGPTVRYSLPWPGNRARRVREAQQADRLELGSRVVTACRTSGPAAPARAVRRRRRGARTGRAGPAWTRPGRPRHSRVLRDLPCGALLQHKRPHAGQGKLTGEHQAVRTATDDHDIDHGEISLLVDPRGALPCTGSRRPGR
jgi:hypothetical protein